MNSTNYFDYRAGTDNFTEFYLLLSLRSNTTNPQDPIEYHLQTDVETALTDFSRSFARSILEYILVSGTGECRYAYNMSYDYFIGELQNTYDSRNKAYNIAYEFDRLYLAQALTDVFYGSWKGKAYGGRNWGECTKTALMYLTRRLDDISFIDRSADLHHNGGTLFSKYTKNFILGDLYQFREFLNLKFSVTDYTVAYIDGTIPQVHLTSTTAELVNKYFLYKHGFNPCLRGKHKITQDLFSYSEFGNLKPTVISHHDTKPKKCIKLTAKYRFYNHVDCDCCGDECRENDYKLYTGNSICYSCTQDLFICDECGFYVYPDDITQCEYSSYCPECAKDNLQYCQNCGRYDKKYNFNYTTYETKDEICNQCAKRGVICEICDEVILQDHNQYFTEDGKELCPDCYDEHTFNCHACECTYYDYYKNTINDHEYCDDCYRHLDFTECPQCGIFDYNHKIIAPIYGTTYICDECARHAQNIMKNQLAMNLI